MQRVELNEYLEWKNSFVTQQLFNFFRLEAELFRRRLASGEADSEDFRTTGEKYSKLLFAAKCYEMLLNIEYEDLFPKEDNIDEVSTED